MNRQKRPAAPREKLLKIGGVPVAEALEGVMAIEDPSEAYAGRYRLLHRIAQKWGFRLYNRDLSWFGDAAFWDAWKSFPEWSKQTPDRKFFLWSLASSVAGLPGDTAECGVLDGASSHLICAAQMAGGRSATDWTHHGFDSFEGLSEPGDEDCPESGTAYSWKKGDLAVPLERAKENLNRYSNVRLHQGWIPERFHEVGEARFSFVHIDVDLYEPTLAALEFFYPRMVVGGVVLCDDYGFETCPGARRACDEFVGQQPEGRFVHCPTGQGYFVKA